MANPLVAGEFGLRFYATSPLQTKNGYNLGTLCLIDKVQRYINNDQLVMVHDLAQIVIDQMKLRLEARITARKATEWIAERSNEHNKV